MAHSAVTELFSDNGFVSQGGSVTAAAATPVVAGTSLGGAGAHLTLLGVVLVLLLMWGLVRAAGFRFVVSAGVGR